MKGKLLALLKPTVTAVLFYILFRKVDFHQFGQSLRNARLDVLFVSFLMLWLGHYICIFRWRMLMRPLLPVYSFANLFGIYCIGLFFNLAFPTAVGGDVVKMYYAGKPSRRYAQSFAATFLDRDSGMLAMMILACAGILIHPLVLPRIPVALIIWLASASFVVLNVAVFAPRFHLRLTGLLHNLRMPKIAAKVDAISDAFQKIGKHWGALLGSLLISLVNQFLVIAYVWVLALALRIELSLVYFVIFVPVITLISMIPISLNGMGLREYAFLGLFGAVGVPPAACLALGLLTSASLLLSAIPGGVIYLFFRDRQDARQLAALESDFT